MKIGPAALSGLAALALSAPPLHAAPSDPFPQSPVRVSLEFMAGDLKAPVGMAVRAGDAGRKYVIDQTGLVTVVAGHHVRPAPFLDITATVAQLAPAFPGAPQGVNPSYDERGLLGLAFHPNFDREGRPGHRTLYTMHNVPVTRPADFPDHGSPPNCQEVIAEWKVTRHDPDAVDPASYRELLRFDKPEFNHNGGTIAFGPDRMLYASIGDGGNARDVGPGHERGTGNAQSLKRILGKIIRIDPLDPDTFGDARDAVSANGMYRIPRDNPFVSTPGALGEIYAYGFRNPYRMSFDRSTGRLTVADVGQDNVEEVDVVHKGGNFGWHLKEGSFLYDPVNNTVTKDPSPDPSLIDPVLEYEHGLLEVPGREAPIAVVGGFVYRGSRIPRIRGRYVFADLTGVLFVGDLAAGTIEKLIDTKVFIKGFGQDPRGELYLIGSTELGPTGSGGFVQKLTPADDED